MISARTAILPSLLLAVPVPAGAQYVGVPQCATKCHREAKKAWTSFHQPSLAQLDDPKKAKTYAAPVGGNTHDPRCLACHTSVRAGGTADPVGCESCHDPGGVYLKPHEKAVWTGLRPIFNDPPAIARLCVECHVLSAKDKDLADAGHPTGRDFAFAAKLEKMKHWPSEDVETRPRRYDAAFYAKVGAAAAPQVAKAPAGTGGTRAAAAGSLAGSAARGAKAAAPAGDDDEYKDLGADEFAAPVVPAPAGAPAPPRRVAARELVKTPVPDDVPTYPEPAVAMPLKAAPAPAPDGTAPAVSLARADTVTALRGRAAVALTRALKAGRGAPGAAPRPPASFDGPDGELLELQDEVLALALQALAARR